MKRQTFTFAIALFSLVASAAVIGVKLEQEAVAGEEQAKAAQEQEFVEYRVCAGDNLFRISQSFLGDAHRWREIASYNGISNPASLRAGDAIRIPMNGVTPADEAKPFAESSMAISTSNEVVITEGEAAGFLVSAPTGGAFRHMIPYQGDMYAVFSVGGDDHYTKRVALNERGEPCVTDIMPGCPLSVAYDCGSLTPDRLDGAMVDKN